MPQLTGTITIRPGMLFGEPCINATRIPAVLIAEHCWHGSKLEHILEAYTHVSMTKEDVLVCCWYMATFGTPAWKKRWGKWLETTNELLWAGRYEECPMPPQIGGDK